MFNTIFWYIRHVFEFKKSQDPKVFLLFKILCQIKISFILFIDREDSISFVRQVKKDSFNALMLIEEHGVGSGLVVKSKLKKTCS